MNFALEVVNTVRNEEPELFDADLGERHPEMIEEAVDAELQFAADVLGEGVPGMTPRRHPRLPRVRRRPAPGPARPAKRVRLEEPVRFMELQDVQELSNFFERTVSSYQTGIDGDVSFDEDF